MINKRPEFFVGLQLCKTTKQIPSKLTAGKGLSCASGSQFRRLAANKRILELFAN